MGHLTWDALARTPFFFFFFFFFFFRVVSSFNILKTLTLLVIAGLFWCFHNLTYSHMDYKSFNVFM